MSLPPSYNLLAKLPNRVYIETGIYRGDSIQLALDAGFEEIIGVELFSEHIDFCRKRFDGNAAISYVLGDSAVCLWNVIKDIDEPITFFLDSHSQLFEDEPPMENPFPLLYELRQIARHPIKTHTIIIDDVLYMTHPDVTGWSRSDIEYELRKINDYKIEYVANPVKNNLLICCI